MTIQLTWARREPPLTPAAVLATGDATQALASAVRERLDAGLELRAAADADSLLVLGDAGDLPWVDGVRYLGWDGRTLTPTTHRPLPSADLWRAAVSQGPDDDRLVVLLPGRALVTAVPRRAADPSRLLR